MLLCKALISLVSKSWGTRSFNAACQRVISVVFKIMGYKILQSTMSTSLDISLLFEITTMPAYFFYFKVTKNF